MNFDIKTLSVIVAVSSLVFAFACLTVAHMVPSAAHLRDWARGAGFAALSTLLVGLRGLIPELVSAAIANTCLTLGFSYLYLGACGMLRRPRPGPWLWLFGASALVSLAWFTVVEPSVSARVMVVSLMVTPLLTLIGLTFWRYDTRTGPSPLRIANRITVAICVVGALLFAARFASLWNGPALTNYTSSTSALFIAPYVWAILFNVWFSIHVTLTVSAHLQAELATARDQAEANNLAKSQFLANMSHEIRTPMNAILGMLKLLGHTELKSQQLDYVNKTQGAAKSLLGLLNDILDFSKMDAGKMELEQQRFGLDPLLRDLAVVLCANVGNKPVEVLYDIDPALPSMLVGDAMRLQQVLINLAGNAIKFTATGQVVLSIVRDTTLTARPGVASLRFAVQDTGIGIAPENQAKIFSGFSQAEASTTRRFGGSGLGLAISKRFIELMGGQLVLNSQLGVGSTFSFTLDLPIAEHGADDEARLAPLRVLLVDDNSTACALLAKMMRSLGWQVDAVRSGPEALQQLPPHGNAPYDCIFVDWQMPQMDGWETLARLQARQTAEAGPAPRMVLLSSNSRDNLSHRTRAEQSQLHAFLVKPVTAAMLREAALAPPQGRVDPHRPPRSSLRRLAGMRILVVEDNAMNQQVAEELLSAEGALVSIAADGRQGVEAIASAQPPFDIVLMDVQMPVMDGYAATQAIRKTLRLTQLPVVGLTANAMASDKEACLQSGMNAHIGKPFDVGQLVTLLRQLTGRPRDAQGDDAMPERLTTLPTAVPQDTPECAQAGMDWSTALQRMGGNHALYVRSAQTLYTALESLTPGLQQCLERDDLPQAQALLHTLKGNTGTLGLQTLSQELARLETLCKDRDTTAHLRAQTAGLPAMVQTAQDALAQVILRLTAPMAPPTRAPGHPPAQDAARAQVGTLIPLLEAHDLTVLAVFANLRASLAALPADQLEALETALQDLALDEALQACQAIVAISAPS